MSHSNEGPGMGSQEGRQAGQETGEVGSTEGNTRGGGRWAGGGSNEALIPAGAASAPVGLDPSCASQPGSRSLHSALHSAASAAHPHLSKRGAESGPAIHCTAHLPCWPQGSGEQQNRGRSQGNDRDWGKSWKGPTRGKQGGKRDKSQGDNRSESHCEAAWQLSCSVET